MGEVDLKLDEALGLDEAALSLIDDELLLEIMQRLKDKGYPL